MDEALFYAFPFLKNILILYLTVFGVYLGFAINKSGVGAFNFVFWLEENRNRFVAGAIFILTLSSLMALTDVSPIFKLFGFDINASPVGLGLALAAFMGFISTKQTRVTKKGEKVKDIQIKASEIIQKTAEIQADEKATKPTKAKPRGKYKTTKEK